jgi:hypothetical protein
MSTEHPFASNGDVAISVKGSPDSEGGRTAILQHITNYVIRTWSVKDDYEQLKNIQKSYHTVENSVPGTFIILHFHSCMGTCEILLSQFAIFTKSLFTKHNDRVS